MKQVPASRAILLALVLALASVLVQFTSTDATPGDPPPSDFSPQEPTMDTPGTTFPESNQPPHFYVPLSNEWTEVNEHWSIRLAEVVKDNRCPDATRCEESGSAEVRVQLMQPDVEYDAAYFETLKVFGLNRYPMPDGEIKPTMLNPITISRTHAVTQEQIGFVLTLVDLRPYPKESPSNISGTPYVGLFRFEPLPQ